MDKSVTVVAPAYNHEQFITGALESVARQNYRDMELIVLDDKSSDHTVSMIQELLEKPSFRNSFSKGIRFIQHQENKGAHYSINEGLTSAKGKYLAIINTDDTYGLNRLNLLLDRLTESDSEFAFGGICAVDENDQPINDGYGKAIMKYQDTAKRCPTITMALTRGNSTISTGNMVFTADLYRRLNGFRKYRYVHDWDFALRAALETEPIFVPEAIYYYRLHTHNTITEIAEDRADSNAAESDSGTEKLENPLIDFLRHVIKGEYTNRKIPSLDVWDYFFRYKKYYDDDDGALWAWEEANRY